MEETFTAGQEAIVASWGAPVDNFPPTCSHFFPRPDGKRVVCLERFMYTVAISVLSEPDYREWRWCYGGLLDAAKAMAAWKAQNFEGKPQHFIKEKA